VFEHERDFVSLLRKAPRRLTATRRSHSSSLISAAGLIGCSMPALLKAMSTRPNRCSPACSAALTSSPRATSQDTASDRPPACSIMRAVSRLPSAATSATTTLAPSRAKARAVARPMPLVAPVTNATFPPKRPLTSPPGSRAARLRGAASPSHHDLDRRAGGIARYRSGTPSQTYGAIEDPAGLDLAVEDVGQQLRVAPSPRQSVVLAVDRDARSRRLFGTIARRAAARRTRQLPSAPARALTPPVMSLADLDHMIGRVF
jgi:hypothetical protein